MTDDARKSDTHRDLSAIRAVAGEDETRDDTPEVQREARQGDDPKRDARPEGRDRPYDSDRDVAARARQNVEGGAAPGTTHDPNSVTTGTEVEPDRD